MLGKFNPIELIPLIRNIYDFFIEKKYARMKTQKKTPISEKIVFCEWNLDEASERQKK